MLLPTLSKPRLKVCFFAHLSSLLGAERMLLDLVTDLWADHGVSCLVILPEPGPLSLALAQVGAKCLFADYGWWCHTDQLDHETKTRMVSTGYELLRQRLLPALKIFDPDVIWTQTMVIPWGSARFWILEQAAYLVHHRTRRSGSRFPLLFSIRRCDKRYHPIF